MNNNKRIIEVAFPVEAVSGSGARQITGLHTWWARRPLGPSRATAYAALVDNSMHSDQKNTSHPPKHNFIAELTKWENAIKPLWIKEAREDILESYDGKPPKVLDPFGGGGSIPLEAQRLGCETYSCDLNPVAVLIQRCTLEYPQRYKERLYNDVKKWGEQIVTQLKEELEQFYTKKTEGTSIFAYIWARTLPCQNLNCNTVIPLIKEFWLAKNTKQKIALFPYEDGGQIAFSIIDTAHEPIPENFDPGKGTINNGIVTCPLCNSTIPSKEKRLLFQAGMAREQILSVVIQHQNITGKQYRLATDEDIAIFNHAQRQLFEKRQFLKEKWKLDPVPDEPVPKVKGQGAERAIAIHNYNLDVYGALFNPRQQLCLIILTEKIRNAYSEMLTQGYEADYAQAVSTYLVLCHWLSDGYNLLSLMRASCVVNRHLTVARC